MQSVHVTTPPSHTDVEIFYICIHTQQLTKIQMTSRESVVEEQEREREREMTTHCSIHNTTPLSSLVRLSQIKKTTCTHTC
jgi:hypothetical protein